MNTESYILEEWNQFECKWVTYEKYSSRPAATEAYFKWHEISPDQFRLIQLVEGTQ